MIPYIVRYALGPLIPGAVGQWIEGEVEMTPERFRIDADICRVTETGEFSLYRVQVEAQQPFTAALFLSILTAIAQPPFTPSATGLRLEARGDHGTAQGEVARLLDPVVRRRAGKFPLPPEMRDDLDRQLARIAVTRRLQELRGCLPYPDEPQLI